MAVNQRVTCHVKKMGASALGCKENERSAATDAWNVKKMGSHRADIPDVKKMSGLTRGMDVKKMGETYCGRRT